jgi:predicted amidohydrolase YtcJ
MTVHDAGAYAGFYAAVRRQKLDGTPRAGWFPEQRMSRDEALRSWTVESAYAEFEKDRKGSLERGKFLIL